MCVMYICIYIFLYYYIYITIIYNTHTCKYTRFMINIFVNILIKIYKL